MSLEVADRGTSARGSMGRSYTRPPIDLISPIWFPEGNFSVTISDRYVSVPSDRAVLTVTPTNSGCKVNASFTTGGGILELRRLTGLTWDQLARVFHVDRRSLHFWASGKPLSPSNEERLNRLVALICKVDRGSAAANRSALLAAHGTVIPLDLLVESQWDRVLTLLGPGSGRSRETVVHPLSGGRHSYAPPAPADLVGALQTRVHENKGRLRAARPLRVKKTGG
jgi:DNA-binding transcriptional regulator YiaG